MNRQIAPPPLRPAHLDGEVLRAGGTQVFVRRHGSGPAVVCAHAIGHGSRDFEALAQRNGDKFEFIALDWPGHGNSPDWDGGVSSQRYATILMDLIVQLGLRRPILLGNSIGGGASIVAAAQMSERIRGLVLCNTAGLVKPNLFTRFFCRRKAEFFGRAERRDPRFPQQFREYYETTLLPSPAAALRREEIVAAGMATAPAIRQAWLSFAENDADLRPLAETISGPVLIAWAKDDKVNAWRFSRRGAEMFPNRRVELMPGGHSAFLESPEIFDPVFLRWADRLSP